MEPPLPAAAVAVPPARGRRKWFAAVALAISAGAVLVLTIGGIGENLVYYWGPTELRAAGDQAVGATIRLGGQVAKDSIRYGEGVSGLEFDVTDGKAGVHVRSSGVPPQMFREGIGVVVEGTMTRAGHFESSRLMVSHSNEYRAPEDGEKPDVEDLMRSTQGLAPEEGEAR
ncbi:MAG TPA: cytochrome c maturation protein CcmE [Vicinamibacteria bacterium]|nr:cytochrome c maturation protein CcmE [Vicinamibacteria bacterium]